MTALRRRLPLFGALLVALGLIWLVFRPAPVRVELGRVERGGLVVTVDEEGETRVRDRFVIAAPIAGRVARLTLEAGDAVQVGSVVARMHPLPLDPRTQAEASARLDAAEAAVRGAEAACAALENADEVAALEQEWSALSTELEDAVRDWRVLAAAAGFVEEAQREFERTRQPAVLREASRAFAAVTGERYERIAQDEKGAALVVVERGGQVKQAGGELSRGTAEALYLAVRLGLAGELTRRGTALPLIMDDVLVNLDPERAAAMASVLGEIARRHQVLFFTCHPSTRDLLVNRGHAARVVEL